MATFSKYFNEILSTRNLSCLQLVHPNKSCRDHLLQNLPMIYLTTAEFFFPIFFLPLLVDLKSVTREKFFEVCDIFFNSVQTAALTAITAVFLICKLNAFRGKMSYVSIVQIPSLIGGWSIFFANEKVRTLFGHAAATVISEIWIRDAPICLLKLLRNSRAIRTGTFMVLSAFIMDTLYEMSTPVFWFIKPVYRKPKSSVAAESDSGASSMRSTEKCSHHICQHRNTCESHVFEAFTKYLTIGLCLEGAKAIFKHLNLIRRRPFSGLVASIQQINPSFLIFFTGYPTLYRLTNCLLNRHFQEPRRTSHILAAFIGGFPFYFHANELSILSHTIVTFIELGWTRYLQSSDKDSKVHRLASRIPFAHLVYILGGAFMYNVRVFYPWLAPKFLVRLIKLLTNYKFDEISQTMNSFWVPTMQMN